MLTSYRRILTFSGRVIVSYQGYGQHLALLQNGTAMGTTKLWYDKPHQQYYLLVSFEAERPDPTPDQQKHIVEVVEILPGNKPLACFFFHPPLATNCVFRYRS